MKGKKQNIVYIYDQEDALNKIQISNFKNDASMHLFSVGDLSQLLDQLVEYQYLDSYTQIFSNNSYFFSVLRCPREDYTHPVIRKIRCYTNERKEFRVDELRTLVKHVKGDFLVSTNEGIMSAKKAIKRNRGGKIIQYFSREVEPDFNIFELVKSE